MRKPEKWNLYGYKWFQLKAFRGRLWTIRYLLDEIETARNYDMDARGPEDTRANLALTQRRLRAVADGLDEDYRVLLRGLSTEREIARWNSWIDAAVGTTDQVDLEWGDASEVAEARHTADFWDALVAVRRLIERELRVAVKVEPKSELDVQNLIEALLIGKDIEYVREREVMGVNGERRRADFTVGEHIVIEVKFCSTNRRVTEIGEEVSADIAVLAPARYRLFFVIYDRGCIAEPQAYEATLEGCLPGFGERSICVRVVKH